MTRTQMMRAAAFALAFALVPGLCAAAARAAAPGVNETCLMCHAAADAKGAGGKPIAVDAAKFAGSVHGSLNLKCTDCHTDVSADKIPHAEKLKPVNCATCHEQPVKEYAATVHGKARKGGNDSRRDLHRLPRHARHPAREELRHRGRTTPTSKPHARAATATTRRWQRASFRAAASRESSTTAFTAKR